MAERIKITGLWTKDTKIGPVMSAKVSRAEVMDALARVVGDQIEISILTAKPSDNPRAASHNMFVAEPWRRDDAPAPDPF